MKKKLVILLSILFLWGCESVPKMCIRDRFIDFNLSQDVVMTLYSHLFGDDLDKIVNSNQETIKDKGQYGDETYYYMITKYNNCLLYTSII